MTFGRCLYSLILMPLQLLFEFIYDHAYNIVGHPGIAIIVLSLAINILVLPLYMRADAMQEKQRNTEARLQKGVSHIKKTFRGDERTMMLQAYYRQNAYSPLSALRGATSLLLEIPFFIAAYRFLSSLSLLNGVSLGPVSDLSRPDALIAVGGLTVNLLPFVMTAINLVSSAIYSRDYPLKTKLQLYGMALIFLVLLYDSPSGLVFYWTLNNLFSLVKTVFYKLKDPRKVLCLLSFAMGVGLAVWLCSMTDMPLGKTKLMLFVISAALCVPLLLRILRGRVRLPAVQIKAEPDKSLFITAALILTVLTGLLIPSAVIGASPQEFVDLNCFVHPVWYIVSAALVATGTFMLWFSVFYWLAAPKARVLFDYAVCMLCGCALVEYMCFGNDLGTISSSLEYDTNPHFSLSQYGVNLAVLLAAAFVLYIIVRKSRRVTKSALTVAAIAMCCMSAVNIFGIRSSINRLDRDSLTAEKPSFTLSKSGKNVAVIILDRAMGEYIPYIFNEKPELTAQYDGFTYYNNVISYGGHTNFATPALFGGYEYTPIELNRRDTEKLADKHDEALRVMPALFDAAGFEVKVFDPPYAGYQEIPDLSIYDEYPNVRAYITKGVFTPPEFREQIVQNRYRNFFCFSLSRISPLILHSALYDKAAYHKPSTELQNQIALSPHSAVGMSMSFQNDYSTLEALPEMTRIKEDAGNTLLLMMNDTTHGSVLLQEPEYVPAANVDNTEYDAAHADRFMLDGRALRVETESDYSLYQVNMAALLRIGEWLDWLRDSGVYDNTRIIITSDHGFGSCQLGELMLDESADLSDYSDYRLGDAECYFPLLMVKDFGSAEFKTSSEFMTNADVPTFALNGIIEDPVNPFTGKPLSSDAKTAGEQLIISGSDWVISVNNGNRFMPAWWYSVHDNIWERDNWSLVAQDAVLPS